MTDNDDPLADRPAERPRRSARVATWTAIFGIPILLAAEILDSTEYFTVARDLFGLLGPDRVELTPEQVTQLTAHIDRSAAAGLSELKGEIAALRAELRGSADRGREEFQSRADEVSPAAGPAGDERGVAADKAAFAPLAWVQLGDDGGWIARAIFAERAACPEITVGGQAYEMLVRHSFAEEQFPVLVCEFRLGTGERAAIEDLALPVPPADAQQILLIGDTGCRLAHFAWQGCRDRGQWPFRRLLAAAAADHVDLAIHVGDYHYREKPCIARRARCAGSPWGDTWEAWREDFFEPAREALQQVPWIMVRGNHEKCERAGGGWHHFLSPAMSDRAPQDRCREFTEPYRLALADGPHLVILDTAYDDGSLYGDDKGRYARWKESVGQVIGGADGTLWLLLHQPLRTLPYKGAPAPPCRPDKGACPLDAVRDALALRHDGSRSDVARDVVIGGDTHMFQYVAGTGDFVQVVAGMGGTALDSASDFEGFADGARQMQREIGGVHYTAVARYGFALLTDAERGWVAEVSVIDQDDRVTPVVTCALDHIKDFDPHGCQAEGEAWRTAPTTAARR